MQMIHFREILIKQSLKYISCSLKRCNIHVCILIGYKIMPFWHLKGPFRTAAIKLIDVRFNIWICTKFLTPHTSQIWYQPDLFANLTDQVSMVRCQTTK